MPTPLWLRALEHRDFRLFWTAQLLSLIGSWMQTVGQSWLVLTLTNSAFMLGLINALQFAPMLVFALVAGTIVDRLRKRRLILASQTTMLVQSLVLAALVYSGHVRYWHVAILATVFGFANTLDLPARQSFVVEMVGKPDLANAIALNSAIFNAARVVGPAVAGFLVARYGLALAFLLNGVSFIPVIVALSMIHAEGRPHGTASGIVEASLEAIRWAAAAPRIAVTLLLVATVSVFVFNYNVLVPLLARDVLHQDAHGFGVLMASLGVGALAGALAIAAFGHGEPRLAVIVTAAVVLSVTMIAVGAAARAFAVAAVLLVVLGFAGIVFMASANTSVQMQTPDALRGRMMSLYMLVFAGVAPVGAFFNGSVAQLFGVPAAFLAGGALSLVLVVGVASWWRRPSRLAALAGLVFVGLAARGAIAA